MLTQIEFSRLHISEKPPGYYSDSLCVHIQDGLRVSESAHEIADVVLARAQLYLCSQPELATALFLAAFNILAHARAQVRRRGANGRPSALDLQSRRG